VTPRMEMSYVAIKIHSYFRGFSTKKCVSLNNLRVISDVKEKDEDIQWRLVDCQVVDLILENEKEHLICELVYLQEMGDFIFVGKSIEQTSFMGT